MSLEVMTVLNLGNLDSGFLLNIVRISGGLTRCDGFSLYQGRSWTKYVSLLNTVSSASNVVRNPSPLIPQGWPLSWVRQVLYIPETKINELRGLDATIYSLFLRACSKSISRFHGV